MPALLQSELPVRVKVRHHWIVMLRWPSKWALLALALLIVLAVTDPWPMLFILFLVVVVGVFLRWQTWDAEWIILTQRRIVRVRGVPETTTTEASLRLDRISGAVLEQTVVGKMLNFATIQLEATGDHPDVRRLVKIEHPREFYDVLRNVIFAEPEPSAPAGVDDTADPPVPIEDDYPTTRFPARPDWQ